MFEIDNQIKEKLKNSYKNLTELEKSVADFFIKNSEQMDFSSKNISKILYVSEATLSRFAQKCNYKGYREFIYLYQRSLEEESSNVRLTDDINFLIAHRKKYFSELFETIISNVDEEILINISKKIAKAKKLIIFSDTYERANYASLIKTMMKIGKEVIYVDNSEFLDLWLNFIDETYILFYFSNIEIDMLNENNFNEYSMEKINSFLLKGSSVVIFNYANRDFDEIDKKFLKTSEINLYVINFPKLNLKDLDKSLFRTLSVNFILDILGHYCLT